MLGITRWSVLSVRAQRDLTLGEARLAPFTEVSWAHVGDRVRDLFQAERFYGSRHIWSVSLGGRMAAGTPHHRMGRDGVAVPPGVPPHHQPD